MFTLDYEGTLIGTYCINVFCRLLAEKINKNERKNKAEIITDIDCCKNSEFWLYLGEEDDARPEEPFEVLFLKSVSELEKSRLFKNINVVFFLVFFSFFT